MAANTNYDKLKSLCHYYVLLISEDKNMLDQEKIIHKPSVTWMFKISGQVLNECQRTE